MNISLLLLTRFLYSAHASHLSVTLLTSHILDPLAEQPFHKEPPVFSKANVIPDSLEEEKPTPRSRLRKRPIQPAQQLELEL